MDRPPPDLLLPPTTAERLSRLRLLLRDAQTRASDGSAFGEHLAVIALDGVGELAVGLCVHERGLVPERQLPKTIERLRNALGAQWTPEGLKGFTELHKARNLAQHEGVLPASDHLSRWSVETEAFVRSLVASVFGVELLEVSSALAIKHAEIRGHLQDAERALEAGDPPSAMALASEALQQAQIEWQRRDTGGVRVPSSHFAAETNDFRALRQVVDEINERMAMATFAPDTAEWLWFRNLQAQTRQGPPPSLQEARKALVFVTGWVLRFESYVSRVPSRRWEEWIETQRAPVTGLPGSGPRILDVEAIEDHPYASHADKVQWLFRLADLPAPDEDFSNAASEVALRTLSQPQTFSFKLGYQGKLTVIAPYDCPADSLLASVRRFFGDVVDVLDARRRSLEARNARAETIASGYREAFSEAIRSGLPLGEVSVSIERDPLNLGDERITVKVALTERCPWLPDGLNSVMRREDGATFAPPDFYASYTDITFPASWSPEEAITRIEEGFARAGSLADAQRDQQSQRERERSEALGQVRALLRSETESAS